MKLKVLILTLLISTGWVNTAFADAGNNAYNQKDYSEAFRIWKSKAEKGNTEAQHNLGHLYHNGYGVLEDYVKGTVWIEKAAYGGKPPSQLFMAKHNIRKALEVKRHQMGWEDTWFDSARFWVEELYNNDDTTYKSEAEELWDEYELSNYSAPEHMKKKAEKTRSLFNKAKSWFN